MMNIKFIKLPKALFEGIYTELSSDGKLLYSLLLDRSLLSEKNSLTDSNGRVIVYFTNNEVCDKLKCSHDKATKLFRELERFKLICRHKQGKGKPDLIYVRKIARVIPIYLSAMMRWKMRSNTKLNMMFCQSAVTVEFLTKS